MALAAVPGGGVAGGLDGAGAGAALDEDAAGDAFATSPPGATDGGSIGVISSPAVGSGGQLSLAWKRVARSTRRALRARGAAGTRTVTVYGPPVSACVS